MGTVSSGSAHKMGVIALTLVTASNMMGLAYLCCQLISQA